MPTDYYQKTEKAKRKGSRKVSRSFWGRKKQKERIWS